MQFPKNLAFALLLTITGTTLFAQEPNRPKISNLTVLPSEVVPITGTCTASRSGYIEVKGRTKITATELGNFIRTNSHDGYILTIYPETKRGIFVNLECTVKKPATASATP